ncbi:MAG: ammonium transporter [Litoreibacter sp.]
MSVNSLSMAVLFALIAGPALAQELQGMSLQFTLNTLFIVICGILVMWMAAGFAMVEAGFVRAKNVVNQCAKNMGLFAISSLCFFGFGYGMMFPGDDWILPGILGHSGSLDIGPVASAGTDFGTKENSTAAGLFLQMMFCATIASIVSGALAERMKLIPFFIFTAVLTAIIFPIQASWSWGGGFLTTQLGFVDLAGSTVIHVAGGVAALTGSIVVGARTGRYVGGVKIPMTNFNLPIATLGAFILWMGWFGFNAGSYLSFSLDADATNVSRILLNTNLAGASGVLGAAIVSYTRFNRFDLSFMINGALAGLVSITAEPLFATPFLAMIIGIGGGVIVVWGVVLLDALEIDDVVGAIPVHLFAGIWGTLAVALSNPDATILGQALSLVIVMVFMGATTLATWFVLNAAIGVRVSSESEEIGTDHAEMVAGV